MLGLAETSLLCCLLCLILLLKEVQASYETELGQVIMLQAHRLISDTADHIDKPLKDAWTKKKKMGQQGVDGTHKLSKHCLEKLRFDLAGLVAG